MAVERARRATSQEKKRAFLTALATGVTVGEACQDAGISRRTAYDWREADAGFAADWAKADDDGRDSLVKEVRRRAMQGSDVLLMFLTKQRDPSFREAARIEMSGPGGRPIRHEVGPPASLSDVAGVLRDVGAIEATPQLPRADDERADDERQTA